VHTIPAEGVFRQEGSGGEDDLPEALDRRGLEHPPLLRGREPGVQLQDPAAG